MEYDSEDLATQENTSTSILQPHIASLSECLWQAIFLAWTKPPARSQYPITRRRNYSTAGTDAVIDELRNSRDRLKPRNRPGVTVGEPRFQSPGDHDSEPRRGRTSDSRNAIHFRLSGHATLVSCHQIRGNNPIAGSRNETHHRK